MVKYKYLEAVDLALKYPGLCLMCCTSTNVNCGMHMIFATQDYVGRRLQWKESRSPIFIDEQDIKKLEFELDFEANIKGRDVKLVGGALDGQVGKVTGQENQSRDLMVRIEFEDKTRIDYFCTLDNIKLI